MAQEGILPVLAALSAPTQATLAVVAASIVWMILRVILAVLRLLASLLPGRPARQPPAPASSPLQPPSPAQSRGQVVQTPGKSIKSLMKDAQKKKAGGGTDRHAQHELFVNTLKGHTDAVNGLAFAPGGTALASACDDRSVRVFDLRDVYAKSIPFRSKDLRRGATDVAFGATPAHLAVLTSGVAGAAGLAMLDWPSSGQPEPAWEQDSTHGGQPGLCLRSVASTKGGAGVLVSATPKTEIKVFSMTGSELARIDTGGFVQHAVALSKDGRFVAAATFTADVKVYELGWDRVGAFTGVAKAMDLKGHRMKVKALDFSPDLTKMVTASEDGMLMIWNINVRYALREDPKVILSVGLPLLPKQCYSLLAWGPDGYIAGVHGSTVHILDSRSGEVVEQIADAHGAPITCAEWAPVKLAGPQGKVSVLATGSGDGKVRLWRGPLALL